MKQTIEMASAAYKNEGGIVGVPTGYASHRMMLHVSICVHSYKHS